MATLWSREEIYFVAERGYRLYLEGQLHQAAVLFGGLIDIDPENAYCRKALGAIAIALGHSRLAVGHFSAVIAHDRHDIDALAGRCEALLALGDLTAAKRDLASLAMLAGGVEHARRLTLQFQRQSEFPARSLLLLGHKKCSQTC
jgi:Flp pilus assembly protein TadD